MFRRLAILPIVLVLLAGVAAQAAACTGARAMGMGFAGLAVEDDSAEAVYWAPDALADIDECFSFTCNASGLDYWTRQDVYDYSFFYVTPRHLGLGLISRNGHPGVMVAMTLADQGNFQAGGLVWLRSDLQPYINVTGALVCSYEMDGLIVRARYDGALRLGAAYSVEKLTASVEYYYSNPTLSLGASWTYVDLRFGLEYIIDPIFLWTGYDIWAWGPTSILRHEMITWGIGMNVQRFMLSIAFDTYNNIRLSIKYDHTN